MKDCVWFTSKQGETGNTKGTLTAVDCRKDSSKLQSRHNKSESKSQQPEADRSHSLQHIPSQKASELLEDFPHLGRKPFPVSGIPPAFGVGGREAKSQSPSHSSLFQPKSSQGFTASPSEGWMNTYQSHGPVNRSPRRGRLLSANVNRSHAVGSSSSIAIPHTEKLLGL